VTHSSTLSIPAAYRYCRDLTHRSGPHFSIGFRFLPPPKRRAIYAVYAFCRFTDDLVDEQQPQPPDLLLRLWESELSDCYRGRPRHPIAIALADAVRRYSIPQSGFLGLIEGCRIDLRCTRYPTFDALMVYCDLVATTIRDLSLPIFGHTDPASSSYGRALSTALQLTNIVRDIGEDLERGRIYLPLEELERYGYSEAALLAREKNEAFLQLMAFQCRRIRGYFDEAAHLIPRIAPDAQLAVTLMRNVYLVLVDKIESRPFDVLDRSIRLSTAERRDVIRTARARTPFAAAIPPA